MIMVIMADWPRVVELFYMPSISLYSSHDDALSIAKSDF